jgi:ectoine hydroxylase
MTHASTETTDSRLGPLDAELIEQYHREGFLLLPPGYLPDDVLSAVESTLPSALAEDSPARILERDGSTVRSVYGLHQSQPAIAELTRLPALLGAARQILGGEVYVHQSKINIKAPFGGDQWEWHQDYVYWLQNDGIQRPDLLNVAVFLDEVTEFNGPLTFIPASHAEGLLAGTDLDGMPLGYEDAPAWVATLTANEKFQVSNATVEDLASRLGLVSPKGPAGSVLFFNPNILHSSAANISPFRRAMLMFVYNRLDNTGQGIGNPRPAFLAEPDPRPLQPLGG